jgi:hypothetical protein
MRQHTSAYCTIRQHTSAYVSIRQHTSAYVSMRQHTSAYVSILRSRHLGRFPYLSPAYVSIRQHTSAYVSIRTSACCTIPEFASFGSVSLSISAKKRMRRRCSWVSRSSIRALRLLPYVSIRQHTSAHEEALFVGEPLFYFYTRFASPAIRQHTSAYVRIRPHTSAYVSRAALLYALCVSCGAGGAASVFVPLYQKS